MIVEIKRKHRGPLPKQGVGAYTEFSRINNVYCCKEFEKADWDMIYFKDGHYAIDVLDHRGKPINFCPFCGEKIEYKLVSNIEVVQVTETKTRTVPNMVQQGFKEETYEETHSEERETLDKEKATG